MPKVSEYVEIHRVMWEQTRADNASLREEIADWLASSAWLLNKLEIPTATLTTLREECFDDSHWGRIIDATLKWRP